MRPLELSLEGFTSFRRAQSVRFEELDLFAITGPTGSGKSSLLDAMTFALFGQCMRTGPSAAELVSQGATLLKVQFRFAVKGVEYRCTRTWRNRGKTAESLAQLEKLTEDGWVQLASKARDFGHVVAGVLGMDYDTFTRVIVLPQGQFDAFLKGDARQRHELLRQLAGLQIFEDMKDRASERFRGVTAQRQALEAQLGGIALPDPAEITAKKERLADTEAKLPALTEAVNRAAKDHEEEAKLLADLKRLAEQRAALAGEQAKADEMVALNARLERARAADALVGPHALAHAAATEREAALKTEAQAQARRQETQAARDKAAAHLEATRQRHADAEPQLKVRERKLLEAKGVEEQRARAQSELSAAEKALEAKAVAEKRADAALTGARAAAEQASAAHQQAEAAAAEAQPGGERLAVLSEAAPGLREWAHLERQAGEERARLVQAEKDLESARRQGRVAESALKQANAQRGEAERALAEAEEAIARSHRHAHAATIRTGLKEGDRCPVCEGAFPNPGSLSAIAGGSEVDLTPLKRKLESADKSQRAAESALARAEAQAEQLEARMGELREAAEKSASALEAAKAALAALLGGGDWDGAALEKERQALAERDKRHREAAIARTEAAARLESARKDAEFAEKALAEAQDALTAARGELERRQGELADLDRQIHVLTGGVPYAAQLKALEAERQVLETALAGATEAHQTTQASAIQAEEAERQAEMAARKAEARHGESSAAYGAALASAGMDEAAFLAARARPDEQAAWRQAVEAHGQLLVRLGTLVEQLEAVVGTRTTDEAAIASRKQALASAQGHQREAQEACVELKTWLATAQAQARAAVEIESQLAPLRREEQIYATLKEDLSARKFQAYLLEHLQADLVVRATAILAELSDGRYVLRLADGQFCVEDNWNGGELRKIRTLSGGETFAASLSMALALSERLSMGAELGSLFLDEGFGTLDAETLEGVTQVLESLRQKNRMIGVITHVRALGERLPTQIRVHKAPEGSAIHIEAM